MPYTEEKEKNGETIVKAKDTGKEYHTKNPKKLERLHEEFKHMKDDQKEPEEDYKAKYEKLHKEHSDMKNKHLYEKHNLDKSHHGFLSSILEHVDDKEEALNKLKMIFSPREHTNNSDSLNMEKKDHREEEEEKDHDIERFKRHGSINI